jgi:hypothetical protein
LAFSESLYLDALKITLGLRIYPNTPLAATALAEGVIQSEDDLLWPRFYLASRLADWLPERITAYKASRSPSVKGDPCGPHARWPALPTSHSEPVSPDDSVDKS